MRNEQIKLSIMCTAYNHEKYIRQTLEGFVMQKTDFAFEAIVHDDASTDGTAAIIREYAQKYPSIIKPIFQRQNQYSQGVNLDRDIIRPCILGEYIAHCEGDDYWIDPLKLQKQVDFMEANPEYGMCYTQARHYYQDKKRFRSKVKGGKNETFKELFGGGHAELKLTDPDNVLESGIDIEARLPGKNVPSLNGLSGGEKALVALSIYFAIMKVNAPPFCFLDEVDTALDDINVDRFADYMKRSNFNTQFICVTHRRGTMESADMLYGVTMQEKGVTKLLELNVAELEKKLLENQGA